MKINSVSKNDYEEIMDIWLRGNIKAHNFIDKKYWLFNYDAVKNDNLPKSDNFKCIVDTEIAGFVSVVNSNYIGALFVAEKYQNTGVGSALLEYCVEKYHSLTLNVYVKNAQAVKFYKHHGFHVIREMSTNGENAYIMGIDYKKPDDGEIHFF
ncbi:MAG: GNAT family N-acetyltransferase [Erysipelotrichaceae bacterium]